MNLLDILDDTPNGKHNVVIYPDRHTLRAAFQPYIGTHNPLYRTHSLHRAEYIEDPKRCARVYLRTPRQITAINRNRAIDDSERAYVTDGVEITDLMKTSLNQSRITTITKAGEQE